MTKLIILTSFFRVAKYSICFRSFFKLLLRLCISRIHIRMILFGNFTICLFQSRFIDILTDAENLIVISLCFCHYFLSLTKGSSAKPDLLKIQSHSAEQPSHSMRYYSAFLCFRLLYNLRLLHRLPGNRLVPVLPLVLPEHLLPVLPVQLLLPAHTSL